LSDPKSNIPDARLMTLIEHGFGILTGPEFESLSQNDNSKEKYETCGPIVAAMEESTTRVFKVCDLIQKGLLIEQNLELELIRAMRSAINGENEGNLLIFDMIMKMGRERKFPYFDHRVCANACELVKNYHDYKCKQIPGPWLELTYLTEVIRSGRFTLFEYARLKYGFSPREMPEMSHFVATRDDDIIIWFISHDWLIWDETTINTIRNQSTEQGFDLIYSYEIIIGKRAPEELRAAVGK
jgi:hypothetical protein